MDIDIVSVFPEYFDVLNLSLLGKAQEHGLVTIAAHNLRDWTHDIHHSVDDTPVGGGAGMVMKPEVWGECLDELLGFNAHRDGVAAADTTGITDAASAADATGISDARNDAGVVDVAGSEDTAGTANADNVDNVAGVNDDASVTGGRDDASVDSVVDVDNVTGIGNVTGVGNVTDDDGVNDINAPVETTVSVCTNTTFASVPKINADNADTTDTRDTTNVTNGTNDPRIDMAHDLDLTGGARPTTLIFPNPSAPLFSQRDATELSHARHLVFACGRYEGYDARIPDYYRTHGVDVREYSIGDYVLNGGEVAVSVMLEAITRLLPGFMGNPESIVEESYTGGDALLEHRQYTKPAVWRSLEVPDVLLGGDHGKVDRFRRDEALERTAHIRPDLIEALDCGKLNKADRKTLMALGWEVSGTHPRRLER